MSGFDDGLPPLLSYQTAWNREPAKLAACKKARRIGFSYGEAAEDVVIASTRREEGGGDVYYQTYDAPATRGYVEDCATWARRLHRAVEAVDAERILVTKPRKIRRPVFEAGAVAGWEEVEEIEEREIQVHRVRFSSGLKIEAMPSVPRLNRGKGRPGDRYVLDEAAFCDDLDELLKSAVAFTMWGGTVRIMSTLNGADNEFTDFCAEIEAGKHPSWALHKVDIDDAIDGGLARRICSIRGEKWAPDWAARWRAECFAAYRDQDAAAEELLCIPRRSGGAYLSRAQVEGAMLDDCPVIEFRGDDAWNAAPEPDRRPLVDRWLREEARPALAALVPDRRHAAGFDFARSSHLSVLAVVEIGALRRLRTRLQLELHNVPHKQQVQILAYALDRTPRLAGVFADATGAGSFVAESLRDRYGSLAEPVTITRQWWVDQMPKYRAALEDGDLQIPGTDDVLTDHRALRVVQGVPKLPDAKGKGRHGDSLVALALARQAAAEGALPMTGAGAGSRASEDRLAAWRGGDPAAAAGARTAARSSAAVARDF